jgi:hypothetical protein
MSVVAVLTSVSVSGCSYIFTSGPPPNHQQLPYFDCSTSYVPPVLDTVWAGLNGLGAIIALSRSEEEWKREQSTASDRSTAIAVGLIWLAVSGSSAIYGYQKVGQCKPAKEQLMMRMMRPQPPQSWPPQGYPPPGYPPPGYPPPGYPPPPAQPPPSYTTPPPGYQPPPAQPAPPGQPAPPAQPSETQPPPASPQKN